MPQPSTKSLLLALPPEIISQILTYLSLLDVLSISQTHPLIRQIASILNPFTPIVLRTLIAGIPYPSSLRTLGVYSFVPRSVWVEILVRAQAGWVLDELVIPPGLKEMDWQEVFLRRFLPSWARDKTAGQSWRSLYMRTLRKIHHRSQRPCNKDEPFTSWITLDRKGTVTTNKLYSDTFNPETIIRELTAQNDLTGYPATIRPLVRLTDISIFVLGTLGKPSSYQPSANAHALLHPPLCYPVVSSGWDRSWQDFKAFPLNPPSWNTRAPVRSDGQLGRGRSYSEGGPRLVGDLHSESPSDEFIGQGLRRIAESRIEPLVGEVSRAGPSSSLSNLAPRVDHPEDDSRRGRRRGIPLSRTLSGGRSSATAASPSHASGSNWTRPGLAGSIGNFFGLRHSLFHATSERAENSDSIVRIRSSSFMSASPSLSTVDPPVPVSVSFQPSSPSVSARLSSEASPRSSLTSTAPKQDAYTQRSSDPVRLPYPIMKHPQPRDSHRFYPNHTPGGEDTRRIPPRKLLTINDLDLNGENELEEDNEILREEWPEVEETARWVGPTIVVAALPSRHSSTHSDEASKWNKIDTLPNRGSYVSFDAEDLWAVAPWLRDDGLVPRGLVGKGIGYL
ncbi:F-box domain [Phaffia rhodozyma]|uniref:F-box domain n=1 Tax=Phaffia rhodozyma TaxID=264483 RepID=A0A0F7SRZ8_PHARH|nr:F-box domain [Phaffia rhodozyma]